MGASSALLFFTMYFFKSWRRKAGFVTIRFDVPIENLSEVKPFFLTSSSLLTLSSWSGVLPIKPIYFSIRLTWSLASASVG